MKIAAALGLASTLLSITSCAGVKPDNLGVEGGRLAPCPDSPNCVSSDAPDAAHRIEPYRLKGKPQQAWAALQQTVSSLPRTKVVSATGDYLRAEATSLIFRFVDDIEFQLRPEQGVIAVRSASRIGYSDLGVNRRRVETIRERLRSQGVVE